MRKGPAREIREMITRLFGTTPPWGLVWTEERVARARALVAVPELPSEFFADARAIMRERVGPGEIFCDEETTGHALAIGARVPSLGVTDYLLVCNFYPIATLRACTAPGPGEGLDEEWRLDLHGREAESRVSAGLAALAGPLHGLLASHGYLFAPPESEAFQQRIRAGLFGRRKAWDYLFYLGAPTG
jgi:hypothetical protein